jgi:hypothetical protein
MLETAQKKKFVIINLTDGTKKLKQLMNSMAVFFMVALVVTINLLLMPSKMN